MILRVHEPLGAAFTPASSLTAPQSVARRFPCPLTLDSEITPNNNTIHKRNPTGGPREPVRFDRQGGNSNRRQRRHRPGNRTGPGRGRGRHRRARPQHGKVRKGSPRTEGKHRRETLVVTADVSREEDAARAVAETLDHFGRIDILFNNAGINIRKQPQDLPLEDWDKVLKVNLTSAFLMSKAVYPSMKRGGGGKIINIGSMTSIFGAPFAAAYASTKGGIVQLTKSLRWPGRPTTFRSTRSCRAGSTPS